MDKKLISEKILSLMNERNVDKETLAKDLNITERSLYSYLNADRIPSDGVKMKIARYFNTTVDSIFFEK